MGNLAAPSAGVKVVDSPSLEVLFGGGALAKHLIGFGGNLSSDHAEDKPRRTISFLGFKSMNGFLEGKETPPIFCPAYEVLATCRQGFTAFPSLEGNEVKEGGGHIWHSLASVGLSSR